MTSTCVSSHLQRLAARWVRRCGNGCERLRQVVPTLPLKPNLRTGNEPQKATQPLRSTLPPPSRKSYCFLSLQPSYYVVDPKSEIQHLAPSVIADTAPPCVLMPVDRPVGLRRLHAGINHTSSDVLFKVVAGCCQSAKNHPTLITLSQPA